MPRRRASSYRRRRVGGPVFQKIVDVSMAVVSALITFWLANLCDSSSKFDKTLLDVSGASSATQDPYVHTVLKMMAAQVQSIQTWSELILALLAAVISLFFTGYLFRYLNMNQETTVAAIYEADLKVLALIETILDCVEQFQETSRKDASLHNLLSHHIDHRRDAFVGFLKRISELDLDVDATNEQDLTVQLVDVAKEKITAVSVSEEEFYSSRDEAGPYLERQLLWLSKDREREILRIFVTPKENGRNNQKFREMIRCHNEMIREASSVGTLSGTNPLERYKFRTVTWSEWTDTIRENADLIIYDDKYIRWGPIEQREHRRAQFRANSADVSDAVARCKALVTVSRDDVDERSLAIKNKIFNRTPTLVPSGQQNVAPLIGTGGDPEATDPPTVQTGQN